MNYRTWGESWVDFWGDSWGERERKGGGGGPKGGKGGKGRSKRIQALLRRRAGFPEQEPVEFDEIEAKIEDAAEEIAETQRAGAAPEQIAAAIAEASRIIEQAAAIAIEDGTLDRPQKRLTEEQAFEEEIMLIMMLLALDD